MVLRLVTMPSLRILCLVGSVGTAREETTICVREYALYHS